MNNESWNLLLGVANIAVSGGITLGLFYVGSKTSKIDKMEDQLRTAASEAVDLRIAKIAGEINVAIGGLKAIVNEMQRRLERGDEAFDSTTNKWHQLELRTQQKIADLQTQCASKEDVQRIESRLNEVAIALAKLAKE